MSGNLKHSSTRSAKWLGVLAFVAFVFCAIGSASASAAVFTASATGELEGNAVTTQEWTVNGGKIKCTQAVVTGVITSTATSAQDTTIDYSGCTAFGFAADVSSATYLYTANGEVHLENTITVNVTGASCHVTIGPQTLRSVSFSTNASGVRALHSASGIVYSSNGFFCGSSGSNGTFAGEIEWRRKEGGTTSYDP